MQTTNSAGGKPDGCPVCGHDQTVAVREFPFDAHQDSRELSADEIKCGHCGCVRRTDATGEVMIRMSKTEPLHILSQLREHWSPEHSNQLLLDFEHVRRMDSTLLNQLITLQKTINESDCHLVLCNLRLEIEEVFQITRLDRLFEIRPLRM